MKGIGIDITLSNLEKQFQYKIKLAKQLLDDGVVITSKNRVSKNVNLYSWYLTNKDKFTDEETELMKKLIPNQNNERMVKIINIKNGEVNIYPSISEAGRALYNIFHIVENGKKGLSIISNRLSGRAKNIYKGRFMFYYADENEKATE